MNQESTTTRSDTSTERLISAAEAARILGTKPHPVVRLCEAGTLPSVRFDGVWAIPLSAVTRFVESVARGEYPAGHELAPQA